ncbi:MAG: LLM class F420-dependent oxidoreductase [Vulcanimicrobiota bacterium]
MKIGLQIPNFTLAGGSEALSRYLREVARRAEEGGFASLWVMDHFFQIPHLGPVEREMLESYTTLGFLAACTSRIELGTLVTGVTYRHPGVLAKTVATLDVLSGGRAWLGLGAAWFEREHRALGIRFPTVRKRFEMLEETLRICRQMWSDDNGPFEGEHYQLQETLCVPRPLRQPPLMIGGMGERKTLKLVARYAQACNFFEHAGLKTLKSKLEVLKQHCQSLGTDYTAISKTVVGQTALRDRSAAEKLLDKLAQLKELGFDQAIYAIKDPSDFKSLDLFAEKVIPALT